MDNDFDADDLNLQPSSQSVDQIIAQPSQSEKVDQALSAPAPSAPATFEDHLNAFNAVLNGIVVAPNSNATPEGRWDPFDAGSIARRDYYDLGVHNPQLDALFGRVPESALLNNDVNPASVEDALKRRDMRFQFLPQGQSAVAGTQARATVKPIGVTFPPTPGQFGPGKVSNVAKATPATMPTSFQKQFPQPPRK